MNLDNGEIRQLGPGEIANSNEVALTPMMHRMLMGKRPVDRVEAYQRATSQRGEGKNGGDLKRLKRVGRL